MKKLSIVDVFNALSDETSLNLFNTISINDADSEELVTGLELSKRQYYNRISDLRTASLISRQKGKYRLTSFGRVIYNIYKLAEKATNSQWRLQAVDAICADNVDGADNMRIIDILLDDIEIRKVLFQEDSGKSQQYLSSRDPIRLVK
jgi:predicted transcriptional regulator